MNRAPSILLFVALLLAATLGLSQAPQAPAQRVRLAPHFAPGQTLRYQIDIRTSTETLRTGIIEDPQGGNALLELHWSATLRLEIVRVVKPSTLPGDAAHPRPSPGAYLRLTYEKSAAQTGGNSLGQAAAGLEERFKNLEGRSILFIVDLGAGTTRFDPSEKVAPDDEMARATREMLRQLILGVGTTPLQRVTPGEKWSAEQPVSTMPLSGVVLRTESTYLRDEPCRAVRVPDQPGMPAGRAEEACAVILSRLVITQKGSPRDRTPPDYRQQGLRTAGKWAGSGESLTYISLRTSWAVSITADRSEEADVTISTAGGESRLQYKTKVQSQTHVTRLEESSVPPK